MRRLAGFTCALISFGADTASDHWPQFRGPEGRGLGSERATIPAEFGPSKALLWKTELPAGHGSPCVWGNRIYVTAFDAGKLELIAIQRDTGAIAWRSAIPAAGIEKVHAVSSPATSTPVTDGKRIYVYSGSHGFSAFEPDGKLAWEHPMGVASSPFGSGSSPVLFGDLLVIARDYPPSPFLVAVNKKDGKQVWKAELAPSTQIGAKTGHATPVMFRGQIVLNRPGEVSAYAPSDGKRLWGVPVSGPGTSTPSPGSRDTLFVTSFNIAADPAGAAELPPYESALGKYDKDKDGKLSLAELPANDLFFLRRAGVPDTVPGAHFTVKLFGRMFDGNKDGAIDESEYGAIPKMVAAFSKSASSGLYAVRPSGDGVEIAWSEPRSVPEITAPLEYRDRVYMVTAGGILTCVDAASGKLVYRGRVSAPGAYMASPVAAGGKIFVASAEGVVSVVAAGDELRVLANNDLGEPVYGTPAPVGSALYVRSTRHLWAFGSASDK